MTIVLTGGGSGGHITPILAVANALKQLDSKLQLTYIGQKGDKLADVPAQCPAIDTVFAIRAGKFRRYYGEGWKQIFDLSTQMKNLRDLGWMIAGTIQSFRLLGQLKPQLVFSRGGYVSVPVLLAAKLRSIPYVTHDSDSTPSLANRIVARWAHFHAVALPVEFYPYPKAKTKTVGVPVSREYVPVTSKLQQKYLQGLGLTEDRQVLLVTGGGNGAYELNSLVAKQLPILLQHYPKLVIVHVAGRGLEAGVKQRYDQAVPAADRERVIVKSFVTDLYRYSGAADIIIARAGATNLAEFAIQAKACIIIPAPHLSWQIKHAQLLSSHQAVTRLTETDAAQDNTLASEVANLLDNEAKRQALSRNLASFARPQAAEQLAMLLLEQAKSVR